MFARQRNAALEKQDEKALAQIEKAEQRGRGERYERRIQRLLNKSLPPEATTVKRRQSACNQYEPACERPKATGNRYAISNATSAFHDRGATADRRRRKTGHEAAVDVGPSPLLVPTASHETTIVAGDRSSGASRAKANTATTTYHASRGPTSADVRTRPKTITQPAAQVSSGQPRADSKNSGSAESTAATETN